MSGNQDCFELEQHYTGCIADAIQFFEQEQLLDKKLWSCFVDQFREQIDGDNQGWRGEYWGKMMRGAVLVYQYSHNEELYQILTDTVRDMMSVAEEDGRVSSYTRETEFDAWDLWCRKYVILGMEFYYDICKDNGLKEEILSFISRCADYIIEHIGRGEGQKRITLASRSWRGINSSSILEPIVWLYRLTNDKKYFDFATYIVETGGAEGLNIFELAYENQLYPYQYGDGDFGVVKAYEMMSCFEGLLEYYDITGIEKYRIAAVNFGKAIIDSDVSVIGSCGCTHELFDHTKTRQTAYYDGVMQETCVTVTWIKYCAKLLKLTGERVFADQMELSFYNAFLGSLNTEHRECPYIKQKFIGKFKQPRLEYTFLPVDSYSPLLYGKRGVKVGGSQSFSNYAYYGCCTAIAAAGVGAFVQHAVIRDEAELILNFYENGQAIIPYQDTNVILIMKTEYPKDGRVQVILKTDKAVNFVLKLRLPEWSLKTEIVSQKTYEILDGYAIFDANWEGESEIVLDFDMRIRVTEPISWDTDLIYTDMSRPMEGGHYSYAMEVQHLEEDDNYISLSRGPLTLGMDARMIADDFTKFSFLKEDDEIAYRLCEELEIVSGKNALVKCEFISEDGQVFHLIDYASAGRDWETNIAAWLPKKVTI